MWTTFWLIWLTWLIVAGLIVFAVCLCGGIVDMIAFVKDVRGPLVKLSSSKGRSGD